MYIYIYIMCMGLIFVEILILQGGRRRIEEHEEGGRMDACVHVCMYIYGGRYSLPRPGRGPCLTTPPPPPPSLLHPRASVRARAVVYLASLFALADGGGGGGGPAAVWTDLSGQTKGYLVPPVTTQTLGVVDGKEVTTVVTTEKILQARRHVGDRGMEREGKREIDRQIYR
jgi:hypothetical protein